ncbi:MAG: hypothetical protein ACRDFW_07985 [bacterium]
MTRTQLGPFSLEVPDDWTLSSVILAGPRDDEMPNLLGGKAVRPFQRNLIATMEQVDQGETPESYVARQIQGLYEAGVPRVESRPAEQVKLESGLSGLLTEQVITGAGGEQVSQLQLVSIKNGVAFTIIASHLRGQPFKKARGEFLNMLMSFA